MINLSKTAAKFYFPAKILCLLLFQLSFSTALFAQKIYWSDKGNSTINRANADGSNQETLISTGLGTPNGLVLDVAGNKMYWTDSDNAQKNIKSADLNGGNVTVLVSGLDEPMGIELDLINGKIYWTDQNSKTISSANLDGSNVVELIEKLKEPFGIALDVANNKMYWTENKGNEINKADLSGDNVNNLIDKIGDPNDIELDLINGKMYWVDSKNNYQHLCRANLDGSNIEVLVQGLNSPTGLSLDIEANKMYWTDGDQITSSNLDGSGQVLLSNIVGINNLGDIEIALPPRAPVAEDGSNISCVQLTANWLPSATAKNYYLDVSTVSDFSSFVSGFQNLNVGNATTYLVTGLSIGTVYYYRVRASNDFGISAYSTAISTTTLDYNCFNKWKGSDNSNWNVPSNWTFNEVPPVDADIIFDDNPLNHCELDQDRSVNDITNAQSIYQLKTNGFKLTLKGNLNFTNGAQIDASSANSILEFAGNAIQTIRVDDFYGNEIYNLKIDNSLGVELNSNLSIDADLDINTGKLFSIASGKELVVSGEIRNLAGVSGLTLQAGIEGAAKILNNTDNVAATVDFQIGGIVEAWHFLASPVASQIISESWRPSGNYGNGTGYDLYIWCESTSCWIFNLDYTSEVNWNTIHPENYFIPGRGYLYSVQDNTSIKEFAGILNNGLITIPLTTIGIDISLSGFHMIGNPYASTIDWQATSGWSRSDLVQSGGGYDMWIWNPNTNNYGVFNSFTGIGTNDITGYIAPMQGFFVRAALNGFLSMDNNVRISNVESTWFKSENADIEKFSIKVRSDAGYGSDEIQVAYGFSENEIGAKKLFSNESSAPSLYLNSEGEFLSTQYLTNTTENPVLPFEFLPGVNGNYTISCACDIDIFENLILEDRKTGLQQNMKTENSYKFQSLSSDDANRFVLHFKTIEDNLSTEFPARILTEGAQLLIDLTLIDKETDLSVYDIMGRLLYQQKLHNNALQKVGLKLNPQILIIYLKTTDGSLSQKVWWDNN